MSTLRLSFILLLALGALAAPVTAADQAASQVRIAHLSKAQYQQMTQMGLDVVEAEGDEFQIIAHPGDRERLLQAGIPYVVEHEDLTQFYRTRSSPAEFGGFRTLAEIETFLDSLSNAFPSICTPKFSIGTTIEGRNQWVVKISDNPGTDEDEPELFYNSLIHAREPASAEALLTFMLYLLSGYGLDPTVTDLVNNREMFFLPVVNPDGYAYNESTDPDGGGLWRKNRRPLFGAQYGIDLNRNFGFEWGFDDVGSSPTQNSEVYRGTGPFSEPETINMRDFVLSRHFVLIHNIHTYSNLFLWPYGYDRIYTDQEDFFKVLGDSATQYNGYTPEVGWTLYPTNGAADDWAWGDTISKPRIISITTEIGGNGDGFWPSPLRIGELAYENIWPNLFLAKIADNPYTLAPPLPPTAQVDDSSGGTYNVTWHHGDSINPAVDYRLTELTGKQTVVDDAESDHGYWTTSRMVLSTARKHSGAASWKTQNGNRLNHWLVSETPCEVKSGDSLTFWIWYNLESDYDYFYAQLSTDGGHGFVNLPGILTTNNDPHNLNLGNGITGSSSGVWVRAAFDLTPYVGRQVIFRLSMITDPNTLLEGVYLDDIDKVTSFSGSTDVGVNLTDTIFSFSSKPDGQYWYQVTATDAQGQESHPSAYVGTLVETGVVVGDLNGDGHIALADLSRMIAYLKGTIGPPDPIARGDLNCSGSIGLADLSMMISYLKGLIPAPQCP